MTARVPLWRRATLALVSGLLILSSLVFVSAFTQKPLVAQATGSPAAGWTTQLPTNTSTSLNNQLQSTSCTSTTNCMAVGYATDTAGYAQTLGEQFNGSSWSMATPQNTSSTNHNYLLSVSCTSSTNCWAVGYYNNGSHTQNLAEQYNGSAWSGVAVGNTNANLNNYLTGVTCVAANNCWAVGYAINSSGYAQTLTEHWDNTSWTIVGSPNTDSTHNNYLTGVSCPSSTTCFASGYYYTGSYYQNLVEEYSSGSWAGVTGVVNLGTTTNNFLTAVSCVTTSDCWFVGYYYNGSNNQDVVEQWNGGGFSDFAAVNASTSQSDYLSGVTCASWADCMAVGHSCQSSGCSGSSGDQTEIEQWDGSTWYLATSTNQGGTANQNSLNGIACVAGASPDNCLAVGYYCESSSNCTGGASASAQTMAEQYGGPVQNPPTAGSSWASAAGVGDASASTPAAPSPILGSVNTESGNLYRPASDISIPARGFDLNLTRSFNSTPETAAQSNDNFLVATTCVSTSNCWGVGYYCTAIGSGQCSLGSYAQTLVEHYDGSTWTSMPSPDAGSATSNQLTSISCTSSTDCWAVGYYTDSAGYAQTLGEHYDGTSWSIKSTPSTGSTQLNYLLGVVCTSSSFCLADGYYYNGSVDQNLVEKYDGTSWTGITVANTLSTQTNQLLAIACTSSSDCTAVGSFYASNWQTLAEHYNGSAWTIISSPNTSSTQYNALKSVSCTATNFCLAAGFFYNGTHYQNLVEKYDGSTWAGITVANNTSQDNELVGIACVTSSDCSAVGGYAGTSNWQTLAEHYNGSAWSVVNSGNSSSTQLNTLQGVTCAATSDCWGAGYYDPVAHQELVEHWNGTSWTIPSGTNIPTGGSANVWSSGISGAFGFGWASALAGVSLYENPAHTVVTVVDATGSPITFNLIGSTWVAPTYNASTLTTASGNWTYTKWNGNVFKFNSSGQLTSEVDRDGNTTTLSYTSGQLQTVTDASGSRSLTFHWTGNNVDTVTDPTSQTVNYYYDPSGDLIQVKNQAGNSTYYSYDGNHNLTSEKDPNGNTVSYAYSTGTGQVQSQTAPVGVGGSGNRVTSYAYSVPGANQTATVMTDPNGNQTQLTFTYSLLTQRVDGYSSALAATQTYLYDPNTLALYQQTDVRGTVSAYTEDINSNRLTSTVTPASGLGSATTTSATYNSLNEPLTQTDANGNVVTNAYNSTGDLCWTLAGTAGSSCTTVPGGAQSFAYGDSSNPGRPTTKTDPNGNATTNTYDSYGDLATSTNAAGSKTSYTYDALGRKLTMVTPVGNVSGCGCTTANTTTYTYNALNSVLTVAVPSPTGSGTATTTNTYDNDNNLLIVHDPNGNYTTNTYDADSELCWTLVASSASGNVCSSVPSGASSATYDSDGNVATATDAAGHVTSYGYNALNQKTSVTVDPGTSPHLNEQTTYAYDAAGNVLTTISPRGNAAGCTGSCPASYTTTNTYDGYNRLLTLQDPTSHTTTFTYDGDGNKLTVTDGAGNLTSNAYDNKNQLCWSYVGSASSICASPPTGSTVKTYDNDGNVLKSEDPNGNYTSSAYNSAVQACWTYVGSSSASCSSPPSGATVVTYDPNGNALTTTDPNGNVTTKAYNSANKICWTYVGTSGSGCGSPPSSSTSYTYDANANVLTLSDPNGHVTTRTFDVNNRLCWSYVGTSASSTCASPPTGSTVNTYDNDGNVLTTTQPDGAVVTTAYDNQGRACWTLRGTSGNVCSSVPSAATAYTYDLDSHVLAVADPNGNVTSKAYDGNGNVCWSYVGSSFNACASAPSGATVFTYNGVGNVLTTTQPSGAVVTNTYDAHSRVCWTYQATSGATCTSPPSGSVQFSYDSAGHRLTSTDAAGNVTTETYDSHGRKCWSYAGTVGTPTCASPPSGATKYSYDNNDNPTTVQYPTGSVIVSQAYNSKNQPCWTYVSSSSSGAACGSAPSGATSYTYDAAANLKSEVLPNGVTNSYNYDNANAVSSISDTNGGTTIFAATYTRNASELVTQDNSQPSSLQYYQYTGQNRVCYAGSGNSNACTSPPSGSDAYTYDVAGNLISNKGNAQTYNTQNQVCWTVTGASANPCASPPTGATTYGYDANGDRTSAVPSAGSASCDAYDSLQHLTSIKTGTGSTCATPTTVATYTYSGNDLRRSKTVGSTTTTYAWDTTARLPRLLQETSGSSTTSYVYNPLGQPLEEILPSGSTYYYSHDNLGSTRALTDSSGTTQNTDTYDPYGTLTPSTGSVQNNLLFGGQYLDAESGLYYLRARYYDPATTQFMAVDPLVARTMEPYGYTDGDPINLLDPTGLQCVGVTHGGDGCAMGTQNLGGGGAPGGNLGAGGRTAAGQGGYGGNVALARQHARAAQAAAVAHHATQSPAGIAAQIGADLAAQQQAAELVAKAQTARDTADMQYKTQLALALRASSENGQPVASAYYHPGLTAAVIPVFGWASSADDQSWVTISTAAGDTRSIAIPRGWRETTARNGGWIFQDPSPNSQASIRISLPDKAGPDGVVQNPFGSVRIQNPAGRYLDENFVQVTDKAFVNDLTHLQLAQDSFPSVDEPPIAEP